ncbi:MAG: division/cell wall cluster transcriptional repressor MraZ [Elusimicrobia bacterium]|nr:division/cell wall cluster transcriptional repressor MraZ [Elusimicrobiota bacterium]
MQSLTGLFEHTLDDKNRVCVPSRYRDQLTAENGRHFMLAMGLERCLYLFLPSQWDHYQQKFEAAAFKNANARRVTRRRLFGRAVEAPLDGEGRILIPQYLKDFAGFQKDLMIVGTGARAEVWNRTALSKLEKSTEKDFEKISSTLDL